MSVWLITNAGFHLTKSSFLPPNKWSESSERNSQQWLQPRKSPAGFIFLNPLSDSRVSDTQSFMPAQARWCKLAITDTVNHRTIHKMVNITLCSVCSQKSCMLTCNVRQSAHCQLVSLTWPGEWTAAAAADAREPRGQATRWTETDELHVCPGSYPARAACLFLVVFFAGKLKFNANATVILNT